MGWNELGTNPLESKMCCSLTKRLFRPKLNIHPSNENLGLPCAFDDHGTERQNVKLQSIKRKYAACVRSPEQTPAIPEILVYLIINLHSWRYLSSLVSTAHSIVKGPNKNGTSVNSPKLRHSVPLVIKVYCIRHLKHKNGSSERQMNNMNKNNFI